MAKKTLIVRPDALTPFGAWLKRVREARGLNQAEVGELCQVTQEYISGLERGIRSPSRKLVWRLARSLAPGGSTAEEADMILDEALNAAYGIRHSRGPFFSAPTIRYAQVYENAGDEIQEILGQAQGLMIKALRLTLEQSPTAPEKQEQPA